MNWLRDLRPRSDRDGSPDAPRYSDPLVSIHVFGDWLPEQVRSCWRSSTLKHTSEQSAAINAAWARALSRPGVHLFDGPLCRLEDFTIDEHGVVLGLSATGYKAFVGSNCSHPDWADTHGHGALADALGTSVALLSVDGWAVFGRRGQHLALYPGYPHPIGGTLEVGDGTTPVDATSELFREIHEEVGLADSDFRDVRILALTEDRRFRQPEMVWLVRTNRDRVELEQRVGTGEHAGAWSIRAETGALADALVPISDMTPVLRGVLLSLGWHLGGQAWLDEVRTRLRHGRP
jgi:hypothetical protein